MLLCKKFRNSFVSLLELIPLIISANFSSFPPLKNSNSKGTISLGEIAVRVSERFSKSGLIFAHLFSSLIFSKSGKSCCNLSEISLSSFIFTVDGVISIVSPSRSLVTGFVKESFFSRSVGSNKGTEGSLSKSISSHCLTVSCSILSSTASPGSLETALQKSGLKGSGGACLGAGFPNLNFLKVS